MNNEFFKRYTNKQLQNYIHEQLSYTYWFVFVYDRTQEDVFRAIELNGGKYINRTITPEEKEEWMAGIKGALNLLDLQRIEWNTRLIGDFELIKFLFLSRSGTAGIFQTLAILYAYLIIYRKLGGLIYSSSALRHMTEPKNVLPESQYTIIVMRAAKYLAASFNEQNDNQIYSERIPFYG